MTPVIRFASRKSLSSCSTTAPLAARRVTHRNFFAAHDDSSMKYVEMLARRCKKNQITGLQILFEPWHCPLRYAFHSSTPWSESRHNIQNALPGKSRNCGHRDRPDDSFAHIVANPERHVVISPFPFNAASFISNFSKPLGEVIDVGSEGERKDGLDVCDTVESVEGSREDFGCVGRANQRIWFIGLSQEVSGRKIQFG